MKHKVEIEFNVESDFNSRQLEQKIKIWLTSKKVYPIDVSIRKLNIEVENVKIEVENIVITEPGQEASFKDWFQLLPESCREEALSQPRTFHTDRPTSLSKALYRGFIWDGSPSGDEFWRNIANGLASEIENTYFQNIKKLQDATTMD